MRKSVTAYGNAVVKETDNLMLCTTAFIFLYACIIIIIDRNNQLTLYGLRKLSIA
jgi:hypothetical protein